MLRHPCLRLHAGPGRTRAAGADQPGRPDEERHRLLGGRQAGRQQVQVDVEEGHRGGAAHPVQHGFRANQHGRVGHRRRHRLPPADRSPRPPRHRATPPALRAAGSRRPATSSSGAGRRQHTPRAASGRSAGSAARPRRAAGPRPLRIARSAPTPRSGGRPGAGPRPSGCRRRPAVRARRAADSSRTERAKRTNSSENMPLRGSAPRRSTRSRTGQPARSWGRDGATVRRSVRAASATGGTGEATTQGASSRRARSISTSSALYVGALSSRYAASCASSRTTAARRGTGDQAAARLPTTTGQPARACSQVVAVGQPRRSSRPVRRSAQPDDGTRTSTLPWRARTAASPTTASTRSIGSVSGGWRTTVTPACARSRSTSRGDGGAPRSGSGHGGGGRQRAHDGCRRRRAQEERGRSGPSPCRPVGQFHQRGGRPPSQPRLQRQHGDARRRPGLFVDDPPPHAPPVQRRAHPGADLDVVAPRRRHRVVERLAHGGHLGAHAHHPGGARSRRTVLRGGVGHCQRMHAPPQGSGCALRAPRRSAGRPRAAWPPT